MLRFALLLPLLPAALIALAPDAAPPDPVRVGVYDSRALAVVYAHSDKNNAVVAALVKRRDEARARNDAAAVQAIEAEGKAHQERLHRQGFSTAPIPDILKHIQAELPTIAEQVQVDVLVSKWDVTWQRAGVELVDVTNAMIAPFHPNERALKIVAELVHQAPVPLEELERGGHDH